MAVQTRLRRGPTAQQQAYTGAVGELTYDTERKTAIVHDGATAGGIPMLREDEPRGFSKIEHFTSSGTWTKEGKPDLRRIVVHCYGGGGAGNNGSGGGGGGSGGHGYVALDVDNITTNVSVTIGAGTNSAGGSGGTTYFGSYILVNGGVGAPSSNAGIGGVGGNVSGTGVIDMGGHTGGHGQYSATANSNFGWIHGTGGGPGGGRSGGAGTATGVLGGGGGVDGSFGAQGSVIIYEIYGEH